MRHPATITQSSLQNSKGKAFNPHKIDDEGLNHEDLQSARKNARHGEECVIVHAPQCISEGGGTGITKFVVAEIQCLKGRVLPARKSMPSEKNE